MFPAMVIAFEFWIEQAPLKLSGEIQALQPIALAGLVPWINHFPPVCWSTFGNLVWNDGMYDIMENNFFIVFFVMFYIYLNAAQYGNTIFSFNLFSRLK